MITISEESVKFCKTGFEILGVATFAYVFAKVAYKLATNVSMFVFNIGGVNFRKYGEWAVVTGCTDGIGKAYAEYFAKIGLNVVLISRNLEKLNQQANELGETFKVSTKVIAADFTQNTIYPRIKTILNDLDIGVLVNNVGLSYE
jgi:17beta-estradiol 17-dehydrogenase / very-long-chain 3-oxoacyl-CoA reductase